MTFKSLLCILAVVFCAASGQAQTPAAQTPAAESAAQQEPSRNAQILVSEIIPQARGLKNRDNQIAARIALAELLWKGQEPAARRLYQEAFDLVRQALADAEGQDDENYDGGQAVMRLRNEILESLGRRDPVMARALLGETQLSKNANDPNGTKSADSSSAQAGGGDYDSQLEMSLALVDMENNPKGAAAIVQKQIDQGLSGEIIPLLLKLAEIDPRSAGELAVHVVDKLRKLDFDSDRGAAEMIGFFLSVAVDSLKATTQEAQAKDGQAKKPSHLLNPQVSRELIEFITDEVVKTTAGQSEMYILFRLHSLMDDLGEVAPEQAARLKKKFAELEELTADNSPYGQFQEMARRNDVDAMLEAARKAPVEMRPSLYSQTAAFAWEQGDKARATEIATKNVPSGPERNQLLRTFHEDTIRELITKGDSAQAHQLIAQTRSSEKRVGQLIDLAAMRAKANDKKAAVEILVEAQSLLPPKAANLNQLDLQIRLSHAFTMLDTERSFALTGSTIDQINDLAEASARVANFIASPLTLRDNEFSIKSHHGIPGIGRFLSRDLVVLAHADFQRTKRMFDKFQRPEIRLAAQLYLAKTILEPDPDCACACPEPGPKESKPDNK